MPCIHNGITKTYLDVCIKNFKNILFVDKVKLQESEIDANK